MSEESDFADALERTNATLAAGPEEAEELAGRFRLTSDSHADRHTEPPTWAEAWTRGNVRLRRWLMSRRVLLRWTRRLCRVWLGYGEV